MTVIIYQGRGAFLPGQFHLLCQHISAHASEVYLGINVVFSLLIFALFQFFLFFVSFVALS